ncbi:MAG: hypothetical protein ABFR90_03095 [Planctomycetota bacterium]
MKTFWQTLSRVFHKYLVWSLIGYLILMFILDLVFSYAGAPERIREVSSGYSFVILFCYGFSRVWRFHPAFKKDYITLLTLSPWNSSKNLPRGPIHPFWADAVIISAFMLLTLLFPVYNCWILPMYFIIGYNFGMLISFLVTRQMRFVAVYILLAPFVVYPHFNSTIVSIFVLLLMMSIGLYAVKIYLKQFPWNTNWWKANQLEELRTKAIQERVAQWPFQDLCDRNVFSIGYPLGVFIAAASFWFMHVINWYFYKLNGTQPEGVFFMMISFYIAMFRFGRYMLKYHPPISFFGRFRTGRLIIPGYDIVLVGPIAVLIAGIVMPLLLKKIDAPHHIAFELSTSIAIFLCLACPPSFEKWHYTGKHRIAKIPIWPTRTMRTNQVNRVFRNLVK